MAKAKKRRVLVFMQGTIGDTIVSMPSIIALRKHYGANAHLCLLFESHGHLSFSPKSVLAGLGLVDEFLSYEYSFNYWEHRFSIAKLWFALALRRFDEIFYLIAADRDSDRLRRDKIFFRLCSISELHGFEYVSETTIRPRGAGRELLSVPHESEIRLSVLSSASIDISFARDLRGPLFQVPDFALKEAKAWLEKVSGGGMNGKLVAIAPGAKKSSCLWSSAKFAEVGEWVIKNQECTLVVVGGNAERDIARALTEEWGTGLNACGELSVLGTAALLQSCSLLIGLDTGTTHLASALGTKCIALYSAQDWPGRWAPMCGNGTVIRKTVECGGCRLVNCNVEGHPCMSKIEVAETVAALKKLFGGESLNSPA